MVPLDHDELATRWSKLEDIDSILRDFREEVLEELEEFKGIRPTLENFGDPSAALFPHATAR